MDESWLDRFKRWEVRAFMLAPTPQPLIAQTGEGFSIRHCWTRRGAVFALREQERQTAVFLRSMFVYRVVRRG